jgi:hypothetical protein
MQTSHSFAANKLKKEDILRFEPAEVVDMALGRLQRAKIVLLEWQSLLFHRMNVPVVIRVRICMSMPVPMVLSFRTFRISCPTSSSTMPHSFFLRWAFIDASFFTPLDAPSEDRRGPRLRSYSTWHSIHNHFPPSTTLNLKKCRPTTLLPPYVNQF